MAVTACTSLTQTAKQAHLTRLTPSHSAKKLQGHIVEALVCVHGHGKSTLYEASRSRPHEVDRTRSFDGLNGAWSSRRVARRAPGVPCYKEKQATDQLAEALC